jgi:hypothetical protein
LNIIGFFVFQQISVSERRNNNNNNNGKIYSQQSELSLELENALGVKDSIDLTLRSNPNLQINGTISNALDIMEQKILNVDQLVKGSETAATLTKPVITGAILKDEVNLQENTFQEQQRKLGNGTLTPEHKRTERHTEKNIRVRFL